MHAIYITQWILAGSYGLGNFLLMELSVFLHGMLFANIQLDNISPTLVRLIKHLSIEELDSL